jgi:NAD(P)-dependent dehydrogenase (short-subunit alcohol dehydrogenase family)
MVEAMSLDQPVALVTGANRGIGLEVVRQLGELGHTVYLGARSIEAGRLAASQLPDRVRAVHLDVTDPSTIAAATTTIADAHGRLDVLVNNAAIHYDTWQAAADPDLRIIREALETNLFGAWQTTVAALPLLRASARGRVVNVSSGGGALTDMGGGLPAYRVSKVALNALTRMLAAELAGDRILVNSVCPGWVATDMGGPGGRPVTDGAAGITWAATLPDGGPSGGFFRDRHPIPW